MAGFGASALIFAPIWRDKTEGKDDKQGHSYRLPAKRANIEFAFGKHIEFPVRETYRLKDKARTGTPFYTSFITGAMAREPPKAL